MKLTDAIYLAEELKGEFGGDEQAVSVIDTLLEGLTVQRVEMLQRFFTPVDFAPARPDSDLPSRATDGSAGFDVYADEDGVIEPYGQRMIPLGFHCAIPEGFGGLLMPRSGRGSKGLVLGNLIGLIDSDYRGEVKAAAWNRGKTMIEFHRGDPLFQIVFVPVITAGRIVSLADLTATERGAGGFGSTEGK